MAVTVRSPLWDLRGGEYRQNLRAQVRTVRRIVALLREVPAVCGTGVEVVGARRWTMIVLAVAAPVCGVGAIDLMAFSVGQPG